ncbi:hypothetical protein ES288_D05G028200v1 [Gossypium darwinii]|uniref:Uncharacterized protein n=1 Tax=Gossypium darwinii TaxID=34276 RepID=A0A5D2CEP7_GOSDA|nr:hypothetical protein ES288_D05G028200v1 [Gossypium darwinii]
MLKARTSMEPQKRERKKKTFDGVILLEFKQNYNMANADLRMRFCKTSLERGDGGNKRVDSFKNRWSC